MRSTTSAGRSVRRAGVRRLVVPALALTVGLAACGLGGDADRPSVPPVTAAEGSAAEQHAAATAVLAAQARAVADRDRAAFLAGWAPAPAAQLRAAGIYAALTALRVEVQGVRVLPGTADHAVGSETERDWSAPVRLTWRLAGRDAAFNEASLAYTFGELDDRTVITSVGAAAGSRLPVWLLPDLAVRRTPRTLVAAQSAEDPARTSRLLTFAVAAVQEVLPRWSGSLVAYAPATRRAFQGLIASPPAAYADIAAVTTSVDGSHRANAPAVIVLNPTAFGRLGPIGAHVVVAHEATHVATGAATATVPLWLTEGFADYVGIGAMGVPIAVAARAALRRVRRDGPPPTLPDDAAFDVRVDADALEATYEQSWLAAREIEQHYGRPALVAFYRWVQDHPDRPGGAFAAVLHTSRSAFVARWRIELEELAGGS